MIIRRLLLSLAVLPIMLVVIAGGAWFWLLYSESGARWAWGQAEVATEGALAAASKLCERAVATDRSDQADSLCLPLRRRDLTMARPARSDMRLRKPCLRDRRRWFGW